MKIKCSFDSYIIKTYIYLKCNLTMWMTMSKYNIQITKERLWRKGSNSKVKKKRRCAVWREILMAKCMVADAHWRSAIKGGLFQLGSSGLYNAFNKFLTLEPARPHPLSPLLPLKLIFLSLFQRLCNFEQHNTSLKCMCIVSSYAPLIYNESNAKSNHDTDAEGPRGSLWAAA